MSTSPAEISVLVSACDDPLARTNLRSGRLEGPASRVTLAYAIGFAHATLGLPRPGDGRVFEGLCCVVNGRVVEPGPGPDWDLPLRDQDDVRLCPRPGDAGTVVLVAIALLSAVASAAIASRVNASALSTSNDPEQRRFGFNRFSFDAVAGDPIPVVLGARKRYGGKVIAKIPRESADGTGNTSLRMLICLGHGVMNKIGSRAVAQGGFDRLRAEDLEGIYLNDQPIAHFPGVKVSGRFGTQTQNPIAGFADTEIPREVGVGGIELRNTSGADRTGPNASAEAVLVSTSAPVEAVVTRIRFPNGLYTVSEGNQLDVRRVQYRVRHRVSAGPGAWSPFQVFTLELAENAEFFSSPRLDALQLNGAPVQRDIQVERVTAEPSSISVADKMFFDSFIEVVYTGNTFPGMALVAIELVASEQLTSAPRASFDVEGIWVRVWDAKSSPSAPTFVAEYSANPAWHALELLTNTTWGVGVTYGDARVDMPSLIAWAQYADEEVEIQGGGTEPRFRCNLVMDQERSPIDWLRTITLTGRCLPVTAGGVWRFSVDRPQASAVEAFSDGSIMRDESGVARIDYLREYAEKGLVRPNRLVVQLESAEQDEEPDIFGYPEFGEAWLATEAVNEQTIRLEGVTSFNQAWRELLYRVGKIRHQQRTVEFVTVRPAVAVQPGDRFDLATSLTGWGLASGRLKEGSTPTAVKLDRTVTLSGSVAYTVVVMFPDGTTESRAIAMPAGTYPPGTLLTVGAAFGMAPPEFAEYVIGQTAIEVKPFLCTGVALEDGEGLTWRVRGVEYVEGIYEGDPANLTLPNYSHLNSPTTPPGPLLELNAREITTSGTKFVELGWRQAPEDEENTSTFRIYRRKVGTQTWVLVPGLTPGRRAVIFELTSPDVAYEFVVVAVSIGGAFLSPYDPRHPIGRLVIGLAVEPPPPPKNVALTNTGGNTYTLSWDPVEGAVEYQVLFAGDTTSLPNAGAEDCLVLARVPGTSLTGLELPPNQPCRFYVRSVGANGRLSFTATTILIAMPATPPGEIIKDSRAHDLQNTGTGVNTTYNVGAARLEMTNPAIPATWASDEIDTGNPTTTEITFRPGTANDADDPTVASDPFKVPSIAADQWGITAPPAALPVGMLMPPWPDTEQGWLFEFRTHDGSAWTAYETVAPCKSIKRTIEKYQVRVTMARTTAPYRPALRGLTVVCTN